MRQERQEAGHPMPTTTPTGNLSARLRSAQGRRHETVVEVSEQPVTPREELARHGEGDRCSWSVMAGQRCNRAAIDGTLCRNHLAMMGNAVAAPTTRL